MAMDRRGHKGMVSRRRREDDGEEEGSTAADLDDDSLSEGSLLSNGEDDADAEPSDISGDDLVQDRHSEAEPRRLSSPVHGSEHLGRPGPDESLAGLLASTSSDTNAMANELRRENGQGANVADVTGVVADSTDTFVKDAEAQHRTPKDMLPERTRREHMEYLKQKRENPTFVPNRGGFFLHDNRAASAGPNGFRAEARARGRGLHHPSTQSRLLPPGAPNDQPWAHDLHESISSTTLANRPVDPPPGSPRLAKVDASAAFLNLPQSIPNRTFSSSVLLGKIPVGILFPGMQEKIVVQDVAKNKHTLLPHHRPPLRRDKPVRVSIPTQQPRYIFPSVERSFIFISRALRPNQQGYRRGRGRSNFNPSRGTSVYGGSNYTSSVAVSRRSSLGGNMHVDESRFSGGPAVGIGTEPVKPIVRLPPLAQAATSVGLPALDLGVGILAAAVPIDSVIQEHQGHESLVQTLTMHQPRPQKTVSMADIESPARFDFNPPQQQEQPFHQQMPSLIGHQSYTEDGLAQRLQPRRLSRAGRASATPLSQIPEKAIHAQPFQPFVPLQPFSMPAWAPGHLPASYGPGTVFYPGMQSHGGAYYPSLGPPMLPPAPLVRPPAPPYLMPAGTPPSLPAYVPAEGSAASGTVAHESNGMVYYYDSSQAPPTTGTSYPGAYIGPSLSGSTEIGAMMTPPAHPLYPGNASGVYYAAS